MKTYDKIIKDWVESGNRPHYILCAYLLLRDTYLKAHYPLEFANDPNQLFREKIEEFFPIIVSQLEILAQGSEKNIRNFIRRNA